MTGGIKGIAGSMLIIIFAYAGFEIIGIAASEADNPRKTVPRAIRCTVLGLVGLYLLSVITILPLIPTAEIGQDKSPMVAALNRNGIYWAGTVLNIVLITAILSTMLAAMFGLGRMIRSLADEHHAPKWLKDEHDVPRRGMLFSGISMLAALAFGILFPSAYLFLISSGGFAILFTYVVIIATQIRFRKKYGCPPEGKCQMPGYPYASWIALIVMVIALASMPFIPGQASGMIAGILVVVLFSVIYIAMKLYKRSARDKNGYANPIGRGNKAQYLAEFSKELTEGAAKEENVDDDFED
jgi:L-asparagine transporter-like permease